MARSARWVVMMVLCRSSPSPLRKLSTLFDASFWSSPTFPIASCRVAPNPPELFDPLSSEASAMALDDEMGEMGRDMDYFSRSMDFWIMSFNADMADTL